MTVVVMCAVVTMAAKYRVEKEGLFEMVATRHINVMNDAGKVVVTLSANDDGNGMIRTRSAKGNDLVDLTSTEGGNGTVRTFQPNGKKLVMLGSTDNGGGVVVLNKTGEMIAEMKADDYGNGVVWAGNRKGKGRTLQPGP
jgi:WD40 repeat protein